MKKDKTPIAYKFPMAQERKNTPELLKQEQNRREKLFEKRAMRFISAALGLSAGLLFESCGTHATAYKIATSQGNFYTESVFVDYAKGSVHFIEYKRNGEIRRNGEFPIDQVVITKKKLQQAGI